MRTVTLEFLRHGSPHGHLLSPLARYMALCGSHEPADVSVPFDHVELLSRLRALDYLGEPRGQEQDQLSQLAKLMSEFLSQVPGLVAELADPGREGDAPTHLRIIFNANELAMLPFELANAGRAFPGAGQSLALQPHVPLCITREVRRPPSAEVEWPRAPKILFAYSSSAGAVPFVEHQRMLEAAVEPWVFHYKPDDKEERAARLQEHLHVLPEVTVEQLLDACAGGEYTHIHLLAHGERIADDERARYALALQQPEGGGKELVDGPWLATLLRPNVRGRIQNLVRPTVVTVCACNASDARVGIGAGSSIAHALHESGIPLVIGSQFPLSKPGSVILTQVLYPGLLAGVDPRLLLIDVRRQLRVRAGHVHDWASLVAYAAFPKDLDQQLPRVRLARASRSIEAALNFADRATHKMSAMLSQSSGEEASQPSSPEISSMAEISKTKLRTAMDRMRAVLESPQADKTEVYGLLASALKRKAEIFFRAGAGENTHEVLTSLDQARNNYRLAFEAARSQSWALVQYLVLTAALDGFDACELDDIQLARLLSLRDTKGEDRTYRAWAYGNLLELQLLCMLAGKEICPGFGFTSWEAAIEGLVTAAGPGGREIHSTRRQLQRWVEFFPQVRLLSAAVKKEEPEDWSKPRETARQMFESLPEQEPFA